MYAHRLRAGKTFHRPADVAERLLFVTLPTRPPFLSSGVPRQAEPSTAQRAMSGERDSHDSIHPARRCGVLAKSALLANDADCGTYLVSS